MAATATVSAWRNRAVDRAVTVAAMSRSYIHHPHPRNPGLLCLKLDLARSGTGRPNTRSNTAR